MCRRGTTRHNALLLWCIDGHEDTNLPLAWGRSAQLAAGNYAKDVMFTIAMPSIVNIPGTAAYSKPMLQLQPVHDLMLPGNTNISRKCMGYDDGGRRMLRQLDSTSSSTSTSTTGQQAPQQDELATKQQPVTELQGASNPVQQDEVQQGGDQGQVSIHQQEQEPELSLLYPARYKVQYQINSSAVVDVGEYSDPNYPPKIILDLANYPDDYYCITVQIVILPWTGLMMPGSVAVPVKPLVSTKQVCFYKMDGLPTGEARFTTCSLDSFSVAISNIHPYPIPLYPGSDEPFWYPVAHFKTELNRTGDYHWPPQDAKTSLERWIIAADTSRPFVWTPEDQLYEGWYNMHLDVSVTTPFPSLMAVGLDSVATYNDSQAPDVIKGWHKYLGTQQYPPGAVRGVQHQMSRYCSMEGPSEIAIPLHTEVPFTWEFDGFGDTFCYVDGNLKNNWGDDQCISPLNVLVHDSKNHTLKVVRKDACGHNLTVVSSFGAWGYSITQVPKDPYEELGASQASLAESGLIFESAPLQPTTLKRTVPQRVQGNSGGLLQGPNMQVGWCVLLLILVLQLAYC